MDHEQGAFFFDQQVRFAAFSLAEDLYNLLEGYGVREGSSARAEAAQGLQMLAQSWEIYFSTELDRLARRRTPPTSVKIREC
ncbi:MAG TPA: hypothetical protein VM686_00285 [Polyangiaceae bacterium]|nr:hypothetical protein [Polyangiaceae bacterium]